MINLTTLAPSFILAQLFGFISLVIVVASFQVNAKSKLLKFQIISCIFSSLQYLFLHAYTGFFMDLVCASRNFVFSRFKATRAPIRVLFVFIMLVLTLSLASFAGAPTIIIMISNVIYTWALWQNNLTRTRIAAIITAILYIIYNLSVGAFIGVIMMVLEIASATIGIIRFDTRKIKAAEAKTVRA